VSDYVQRRLIIVYLHWLNITIMINERKIRFTRHVGLCVCVLGGGEGGGVGGGGGGLGGGGGVVVGGGGGSGGWG